jgi:predicted nucleic acid-binding protein
MVSEIALLLLDTNIILRHLLADHPQHSPRATAFLMRIEQGELRVRTTDTVVFETVFTLQRHYGQPRSAIRDAVLPIIELPGIILPGKRRYRSIFDIYVNDNLSFADAYHAVLVRGLRLDGIVSFDRGFDRLPDITRVEP